MQTADNRLELKVQQTLDFGPLHRPVRTVYQNVTQYLTTSQMKIKPSGTRGRRRRVGESQEGRKERMKERKENYVGEEERDQKQLVTS